MQHNALTTAPPAATGDKKKKQFFWHDFTQKMRECVLHGTDFGMRHLLTGWFLSVTALAIAVLT